MPVAVVQIGADKNAFPLIQQAGMQIQPSSRQLQYVVSQPLSHSQQSVTQRSLEPQLYVVTLVPRRIHHDLRVPRQRHRRHLLASVPVEPVRTRAIELVLVLVHQVGLAGAAVGARIRLASRQFHGAVLSAVAQLAVAEVVGLLVVADAVDAGLEFLAFVDLYAAVLALEAVVALADVAADLVDARAVQARRALALVYVDLAVLARHARYTQTHVSEKKISTTTLYLVINKTLLFDPESIFCFRLPASKFILITVPKIKKHLSKKLLYQILNVCMYLFI